MSSRTKAAKSSGESPTGVAPSVFSRFCISGAARPETITWFSFFVTSGGSLAGPNAPNHALDSNPGTLSAMVGTSGRDACRSVLVTPKACRLPARTCCVPVTRLMNMRSILPPRRSVSAGAVPLYGTFRRRAPVISLNFSPARCSDEPMPPMPMVSLSGCSLASAISALTSLAGSFGLPTSMLGTVATLVMAVKSPAGS